MFAYNVYNLKDCIFDDHYRTIPLNNDLVTARFLNACQLVLMFTHNVFGIYKGTLLDTQ